MRQSLIALVVVLAGCCSVPEDVAESADVLRDNTYSLSASYEALLDRAGPPALEDGPEDETAKGLEERKEDHQAKWDGRVKHKKALMSANNTLADRLATWTAICADKAEVEEPEAEPEDEPEADDASSEGD